MLIGCNYWAGHAAVDMWREWRPEQIARELDTLKKLGIERIRIFPNWRDFQPLEISRTVMNWPRELLLAGKRLPDSGAGKYGVDETMLERMEQLLDFAHARNLTVDVALITGWMSGELFAPPAFAGRDLLTDPLVLYWQTALIHAVVGRFKAHPAIAAWSPGNETNCMQKLHSRAEAAHWMRSIADAIRTEDPVHPITSGMHSLQPASAGRIDQEGAAWTIQDNAEMFDLLTVHPYPLCTPHCDVSRPDEFRNLFHAAAEMTYYATVGKRPCIVEEIGAFSQMFMGEETKYSYLKGALWNCWSHGCREFLWWCACSHTFANRDPYTWCALERELGLLDENGTPEAFSAAISEFVQVRDLLPCEQLPPAQSDAVCVLTEGQDAWANAYGCFLLAEQAGLRIQFAWCGDSLPQSQLYFVPGITGVNVMEQSDYEILLKRAETGARVIFSCNDGFLAPSARYWEFVPQFTERCDDQVVVDAGEFKFECARKRRYRIDPGASRALAFVDGEPVLFEKQFARGSLVLFTLPLEEYAATARNAINQPETFPACLLYRKLAEGFIAPRIVDSPVPKCSCSCHRLDERRAIAVYVNNSPEPCTGFLRLADGWRIESIHHGSPHRLAPHDALICTIVQQTQR